MKLIKFIWEFPQNALGFIVMKVCKAEPIETYRDATLYHWNVAGGMSLGKYIFLPFETINPCNINHVHYVKHEYGHSVQSKYLGWLYLIVIGAPSLIWAQCFENYRIKHGKSYYDFYTESWANKLGGVK
jgi:hypothetical protein